MAAPLFTNGSAGCRALMDLDPALRDARTGGGGGPGAADACRPRDVPTTPRRPGSGRLVAALCLLGPVVAIALGRL